MESSVLGLVRKGDELAWEAFVRQFQGRVFGLAYHYVAHVEDARELAQEVFIRIYQNLAQVPEEEGLLPWILRITRNASIDHLRRRKSRPQTGDTPVEEIFHLASAAETPEEQQLEAARKFTVHRALQELTPLNREIILLKEIQGLPFDEIASMLGVPLGTVKSRSNRARLELAQKLRSSCGIACVFLIISLRLLMPFSPSEEPFLLDTGSRLLGAEHGL